MTVRLRTVGTGVREPNVIPTMRFRAHLASALVVVVAMGCTSHSSPRRSSPTTVPNTKSGSSETSTPPAGAAVCSHTGQAVGGMLRLVGGLESAQPEGVPGTVTATRVSSDGSLRSVCSATVGADGTFTLVLAPGRYRVVGRSPMFNGGAADCVADGDVVIPAPSPSGMIANGQNMFVNIDCQRM